MSQKVYEYNSEGRLIQEYKSVSECILKNFNRPVGSGVFKLKADGTEYGYTPQGNIVVRTKLDKSRVKFVFALHNSEYCSDYMSRTEPIQIFNLKGELLVEVRNLAVARKILNISYATIVSQLKTGKGKNRKKEFIIQYK